MVLFLATEAWKNPLSDEVIRQLLSRYPQATAMILHVTRFLIQYPPPGEPRWNRARHLFLLAARHAAPQVEIEPLVAFCHAYVSRNRANEALELFVEAGMAERWAAFHEALRAAAEGSKARLDGLAPEMRTAALTLYDQLCDPEVPRIRDEGRDHLDRLVGPKRKPPKPRAPSIPRPARALDPGEQARRRRARPKRR